MYARTVSRTSVRSRLASRLPTSMRGGVSPASIPAICLAKLDAKKLGCWRGPMWLNARTTMVSSPSSSCALTASCSCVLAERIGIDRANRGAVECGVRRPVDHRRAGDKDAWREPQHAHGLEQVVRAADVRRERHLGRAERLADVRRAGQVEDLVGARLGERLGDGAWFEQVDAPPRHARVRRGAQGAVPPDDARVAGRASIRWPPAKPLAPVMRIVRVTASRPTGSTWCRCR